jgi:hypothetical protein
MILSMLVEAVDPDDSVLVVIGHTNCEVFGSFDVIALHSNI